MGVRISGQTSKTQGWTIGGGADVWDKRYMKRGIVFQTKEEAIECTKRMLAVVKQEG